MSFPRRKYSLPASLEQMELTHIPIPRYLITKQFIWHIRLRVYFFVSIEVLGTYCWKASEAIKRKKQKENT